MRSRCGVLGAFVLVTLATVATGATNSAEAQSRWRGIARLGAEMGGDKLIQFEYDDGSTPDVTAGGGLLMTVGAALETFRSGGNSLDAQVTAGWKYRTIPKATNQEASWSRFPVEAVLAYNTPIGLRFAGGAVVHLGNSLTASGDVASADLKFKTTPGYLGQVEYVFRNGMGLDARYTVMKYEITGSAEKVNANSLGFGMTFHFGGPRGLK